MLQNKKDKITTYALLFKTINHIKSNAIKKHNLKATGFCLFKRFSDIHIFLEFIHLQKLGKNRFYVFLKSDINKLVRLNLNCKFHYLSMNKK